MISVVVPVYKTEKYLKQCVDSVLSQSYRNLDIILIDDGSPDDSGAICDKYAATDPRVRVYHKENRGLSRARNFGLERARERAPKYVYFIDSDDWLEPDFFKTLITAAEAADADIAVCGWSNDFVDSAEVVRLEDDVYDSVRAMRAMLCGTFRYAVWNKLFRTTLLEGIEFPLGVIFEDVRTTYKIVEKAKRIAAVSGTVYHYRQRSGSIVHEASVKRLLERWAAAEQIFDYFDNGPYRDEEPVRQARLDYCAHAVTVVWTSIHGCPRAERKEAMPELKRIAAFVRSHFPIGGLKGWRFTRKAVMFLTRRATSLNFALAALMSKAYKKKQRGRQLFD